MEVFDNPLLIQPVFAYTASGDSVYREDTEISDEI